MRTTIDNDLMRRAMRASGARTKRALITLGLRMLIDVHGQASIRRLRGTIEWTGDPSSSRVGRVEQNRRAHRRQRP